MSKQKSVIDMVIFCPNCHLQHIDMVTHDICRLCGRNVDAHDFGYDCDQFSPWLNPPHKSHRCARCNLVFRIADVPTNGVTQIQTKGKYDTWKG